MINTKKDIRKKIIEEIDKTTSKEERMKIDQEREEKQKERKTTAELSKFKVPKISKNLETEIQIERINKERRMAMGG